MWLKKMKEKKIVENSTKIVIRKWWVLMVIYENSYEYSFVGSLRKYAADF